MAPVTLQRKTPLRATPLPRSRKPVKFVSDRRRAERGQRDAERLFVLSRDGGCLLRGRLDIPHWCSGGDSFHHIVKAWKRPPYDRRHGVCLCFFHNGLLEADADFAAKGHELGLVVREGETVEEAWEKMRAAGLVGYGPEGTTDV